MEIDVVQEIEERIDERCIKEASPASIADVAHDNQGGVFFADSVSDRWRESGGCDWADTRAEVFRQENVLLQNMPLRRRQTVEASWWCEDPGDQLAAECAGQPPGTAQDGASCGIAINQYQDPLRGRPDLLDTMLMHVIGQRIFYAGCRVAKRHLPQRR